ncbi:MAG: hypothetical protein MI748_03100 [Opitutales bacterium]|nr:hypothetical protein [Opitutales bacterium]
MIACSYAETDFDQEPSVIFDISLLRINKSITEWGMEVTWLSYENTVHTLDFISVDETDFERKAGVHDLARKRSHEYANRY